MKGMIKEPIKLIAVSAIATLVPASADGETESDIYVFDIGADDVTLLGNTWHNQPDQVGTAPFTMAGILESANGGSEYAKREIVTATLSDGSEGSVIRFAQDGTSDNYYTGAGNYLLNFGTLAPSTTYTLRLVMKVKDCNAVRNGTAAENIRGYWIAFSGTTTYTAATPDDAWHTIDFTFTTNETLADNEFFTLGCDPNSPFFLEGFEILYERIALVEGTEFPDNTQTGDTTVLFAVAFAVTVCAALVMITRRKVSER